ncbi:hypothetical protein EDB84DRAFT_1570655 [Lactarius hengduanensis]|nr:hypothetical protein EDB84DRAFT_1570655 [Lactarius hengduanensis]
MKRRRRLFPRRVSTPFPTSHSFLIVFIASLVSSRAHAPTITMFFEYLRSIARLAWDWMRSVVIEPVEGWMRRRNVRAEIFISAWIKIISGTEEIIHRVLQPVQLALPRGAATVQGGEVEQV